MGNDDELQNKIIGILFLLGFIIFLALALLKVFLVLGMVILLVEIVLGVIYLCTKNEILRTPLIWGGIALLVILVIIFLLYLIGVVFGSTFLGEQSKEVFQAFVAIGKPDVIN